MKKDGELFIPALRAAIGDWIYYVTFMRMGDIRDRIHFAEEIHKSESLKEFIQRQLTNRAADIAEYLLSQQQRFFNAIVIGVYEGEPDWYQLEVRKSPLLDTDVLPDYLEDAIGILRLAGSERLFAIDGQHRVAGIRRALSSDSGAHLEKEEVCVIAVAHSTALTGVERTRRLFTTLNRYAKPVSITELIALDEDDVAAIVTRTIVDSRGGLMSSKRVSLAKTKAISPQDKKSVTSIVSLYKAHDFYLGREMNRGEWGKYKRKRPPEETVSRHLEDAKKFWETMCRFVLPFKKVQSNPTMSVEQYRNAEGGHLLFRPVGLEAAVSAVVSAIREDGLKLNEAVDRLSKTPMRLNREPWAGLLWDPIGQKMLTREGRQALTMRILLYMMGCRFDRKRPEAKALAKLRRDYAAALNRPEEEIELPKPIAESKS
ncbi:MAG: DGQHR domain-containing protein [Acidobacteria bacterium]|nr:DGQHR domain-containing protein [Acidobacteriota bacterium]